MALHTVPIIYSNHFFQFTVFRFCDCHCVRRKTTSGMWFQEVSAGCDGRPPLYMYRSFGCQKGSWLDGWGTGWPFVPLVLDLLITHDRFGSSSDPSLNLGLNGHLHYPNDIDKSLNEAAADKIRKYRADYSNNPPSAVSFLHAISSTSGRLHSEFIRLLFLQDHRETDHFFTASGVQLAQQNRGLFHFHLVTFRPPRKQKSAAPLPRLKLYVSIWMLMGCLSLQKHILTHHTRKHLVY